MLEEKDSIAYYPSEEIVFETIPNHEPNRIS